MNDDSKNLFILWPCDSEAAEFTCDRDFFLYSDYAQLIKFKAKRISHPFFFNLKIISLCYIRKACLAYIPKYT